MNVINIKGIMRLTEVIDRGESVTEKFRACYHGTIDLKGLIVRNAGIDLLFKID